MDRNPDGGPPNERRTHTLSSIPDPWFVALPAHAGIERSAVSELLIPGQMSGRFGHFQENRESAGRSTALGTPFVCHRNNNN